MAIAVLAWREGYPQQKACVPIGEGKFSGKYRGRLRQYLYHRHAAESPEKRRLLISIPEACIPIHLIIPLKSLGVA